MVGCKFYSGRYPIINAPQGSVLQRHLRGDSHATLPPHLVDMNICQKVGLFYCTARDCPYANSDRFFTSKEALRWHNRGNHPATTYCKCTDQSGLRYVKYVNKCFSSIYVLYVFTATV